MNPPAFAAVTRDRTVIVMTVQETERGAMINWLYSQGHPIYQTHTDVMIQLLFAAESSRVGVTVRPVVVSLAELN